MSMGHREYARHRGCSLRAVQKAIEAGRIRLDAAGKIDPAQADRDWQSNTDIARSNEWMKAPKRSAPPPGEPAIRAAAPLAEAEPAASRLELALLAEIRSVALMVLAVPGTLQDPGGLPAPAAAYLRSLLQGVSWAAYEAARMRWEWQIHAVVERLLPRKFIEWTWADPDDDEVRDVALADEPLKHELLCGMVEFSWDGTVTPRPTFRECIKRVPYGGVSLAQAAGEFERYVAAQED
jgi:hypothetical protein